MNNIHRSGKWKDHRDQEIGMTTDLIKGLYIPQCYKNLFAYFNQVTIFANRQKKKKHSLKSGY